MPESTDPVETKTYEVEFTSGQIKRITVPAAWKVTFSAIVPTEKAASHGGYNGWGLRFYEAQDKQRAVFTEVKAFRDCSLPYEVYAVRVFGTEDWWLDSGEWTGKKAELVERRWVSSDLIVPQPAEEHLGTVVDEGPHHLRGMKPRANREITLGAREF